MIYLACRPVLYTENLIDDADHLPSRTGGKYTALLLDLSMPLAVCSAVYVVYVVYDLRWTTKGWASLTLTS